MKKSVVFSIVIAVVLTIGVIAAAMSILNADVGTESEESTQADSPTELAGEDEAGEEASTSDVATRPDCPAGPVAGVELPCLGGEFNDGEADRKSVV